MPPFAVPKHAGMVEGLAIVKRRRSEGSVAKSLSIEIVRVVFALLYDNARTFLQECQRARAPRRGLPPRVGRVGPKSVYFFMENRNSFSF